MSDLVEHIGASTIQHGEHNDRVYLMHLVPEDGPSIVDQLGAVATQGGRSKIFAKVPRPFSSWFTEHGYLVEAEIPPGPGSEGLSFVSRFVDPARATPRDQREIEDVLTRVRAEGETAPIPPLPPELRERGGDVKDADAIAQLYGLVFASYPFPIDDPAFIRESMESGVSYHTIWDDAEKLVAVSSAEPAEGGTMLEMTDFATDPRCRGQGLARRLLDTMDRRAREQGLALVFTIARARSVGMNLTFHRAGYQFGGTLINNTNISGDLESMNVWYRYLGD